MIRVEPELLERGDACAKRLGLSRRAFLVCGSACRKYVLTSDSQADRGNWRAAARLNGAHLPPLVRAGAVFIEGRLITPIADPQLLTGRQKVGCAFECHDPMDAWVPTRRSA